MPRGDGTGPPQGTGGGRGQMSGRQGRMGGPFKAGPDGQCVCPSCGYKAPHTAGQACSQVTCPKCGAVMTRG